jgi:hypothetical protein
MTAERIMIAPRIPAPIAITEKATEMIAAPPTSAPSKRIARMMEPTHLRVFTQRTLA